MRLPGCPVPFGALDARPGTAFGGLSCAWHNRGVRLLRNASPAAPVTFVAGLALAVGLAGCSVTPEGDAGVPATGAGATAPGTEASAPAVSGDPAVGAVENELRKLAGLDPEPDSAGMTGAFAAAGFDPATVEVSADRTPTGLEVDAMRAAVVSDSQCIFGEVRDGTVTVTVLPVLSSGRCFIGD